MLGPRRFSDQWDVPWSRLKLDECRPRGDKRHAIFVTSCHLLLIGRSPASHAIIQVPDSIRRLTSKSTSTLATIYRVGRQLNSIDWFKRASSFFLFLLPNGRHVSAGCCNRKKKPTTAVETIFELSLGLHVSNVRGRVRKTLANSKTNISSARYWIR